MHFAQGNDKINLVFCKNQSGVRMDSSRKRLELKDINKVIL